MILDDKVKILKDLGFGDMCFIDSFNGYVYQLYSGFSNECSHNTEPALINYFADKKDKGFYYNNPLFNYLIIECDLKKDVSSIFRQIKNFLKVPIKLSCFNNNYYFVILDELNDILFTNKCVSEMKKFIAILDFKLQILYKKFLRKKSDKIN